MLSSDIDGKDDCDRSIIATDIQGAQEAVGAHYRHSVAKLAASSPELLRQPVSVPDSGWKLQRMLDM